MIISRIVLRWLLCNVLRGMGVKDYLLMDFSLATMEVGRIIVVRKSVRKRVNKGTSSS